MALLLAALLAAAGCGRERTAQAPPATEQAPAKTAPTPANGAVPEKGAPAGAEDGPAVASDNGLKPAIGVVPFTSREAGFSATFPAGCPNQYAQLSCEASRRRACQCYCDCGRTPTEGDGIDLLTLATKRAAAESRNVTTLIEELTRKFRCGQWRGRSHLTTRGCPLSGD
jgi:hypothetical protein